MRPSASVSLRDVIPDDLPIFYDHQRDPLACDMAAFPSREHDLFMAHWVKILQRESVVAKTILADGQVAGNIASFEEGGQTQVGYWIGRPFWGNGIATRALAEFLKVVTIRPLVAYAAKHNLGSIRVLEKCGFAIISEEIGLPYQDQEIVDVILRLDA
jgi:RimJ/RimL family protein N-acetyltransferase